MALGLELRDVRRCEHRGADRLLAAAPGRQRFAGRAIPAGATRVRHQRSHRGRQRGHGRDRGRRDAADGAARVARRIDRVRRCRDRDRPRRPDVHPRTRHRPGCCPGRWQQPRRAPAGRRRPRPPLAVPDVRPGRRRSRARGREPVRADLLDACHRSRRCDIRADVRSADRVQRADSAAGGLAIRPVRTQAVDHPGLSRWCGRVRRVHPRRIVAGLAVGRDRHHGAVLLRGIAAAPGAPRRYRAARDPRCVIRPVLHARVRGRVVVDGALRRRHRGAGGADRGAGRVRVDGRGIRGGRSTRRSRSGRSGPRPRAYSREWTPGSCSSRTIRRSGK